MSDSGILRHTYLDELAIAVLEVDADRFDLSGGGVYLRGGVLSDRESDFRFVDDLR